MAIRLSKSTLEKIAGFNKPVLAEQLIYGEGTYWNISITDDNGDPIDITNYTFDGELVRRSVTSITECRNGELEIKGLSATANATAQVLASGDEIQKINNEQGLIRVILEKELFDEVQTIIDSDAPPVYTGFIRIVAPAQGNINLPSYIPSMAKKIMFVIIVVSDGVTKTTP